MTLYLDEFFNQCAGKQRILNVFLDKYKDF
jgi:hypothetical protein